MRTLDSIIQDFGSSKEGGLTHRRPFLNLKDPSIHLNWYDYRQIA
ncbi:MAG: hypothetical protein R3214_12495 [Christiangramia sp.]|nr:hypothetical protein [Christiangramia sp.]